jgi:hypothetical protein
MILSSLTSTLSTLQVCIHNSGLKKEIITHHSCISCNLFPHLKNQYLPFSRSRQEECRRVLEKSTLKLLYQIQVTVFEQTEGVLHTEGKELSKYSVQLS